MENSLAKHLYGVMMWDEIYYDKIPHVFQTQYQFGPLDFYEPEFYLRRKQIIDDKIRRIELMSRDELKQYFLLEYEKHRNTHNMLVNWDAAKLTKQRMSSILFCMGGPLTAMFFTRLAKDYKSWSYGMPDLVLWREDKAAIKFAEVKSERDVLSE